MIWKYLALTAIFLQLGAQANDSDSIWWNTPGVSGISGLENGSLDDSELIATVGQAKWVALKAYEILKMESPELALQVGQNLFKDSEDDPSGVFFPSSPDIITENWEAEQLRVLTVRELKYLSYPFYKALNERSSEWVRDELALNGLTNADYHSRTVTTADGSENHYFPWQALPANSDDDLVPATIGQLKLVFALRFSNIPDAGKMVFSWIDIEAAIPDDMNADGYTVINRSISGGDIKWRGMVLGGDDVFYAPPYRGKHMLIFDPKKAPNEQVGLSMYNLVNEENSVGNEFAGKMTNLVDFYETVGGVSVARAGDGSIDAAQEADFLNRTTNQPNLFVDGFLGSDGYIYYNSRGYPGGFLRVDTSGGIGALDFEAIRGTTDWTVPLNARGGVEVNNGNIYSVTFNGRVRVLKRNHFSGTYSDIPKVTNIQYNDPAQNSSMKASGSFWAVATSVNGKIFSPPVNIGDKILYIDPEEELSNDLKNTLIDANHLDGIGYARLLGPSLTGNSVNGVLYTGCVRSNINDYIYAFPRGGNTILKIDPSRFPDEADTTGAVTELDLPTAIIGEPGKPKSFSCFEGPDGRIYSVPYSNQTPILFWIDPRDDSIGYINLSHSNEDQDTFEVADSDGKTHLIRDIADCGSTNIAGHYYMYGAAYGDSMYFSPGAATRILRIKIR